MPVYAYTGLSEGRAVKGNINAPTTDAVVEQLLNRRIEPLKIQEIRASAGGGGGGGLAFLVPWPTDDDLILFSRQMYTLSKSGVPLVRSFRGLTESTHNRRLGDAMRQMIEDLESGQDLSAAMGRHPKIFNQLYLRVIRMGEETGRMEESFKQLYEYMEVDKETRKQIKSALRYPTFVIIAIVIALFIVNYKVIPAFSAMFSQFKTELPLMTRILLKSSSFTQQYGLFVALGLISVVVGFKRFTSAPMGRLWWDRVKLKLPLVGTIINRATLARYSRSFAMGSRSGLPVIQTLTAVSEAVDNAFVEQQVKEMRMGIERGESLTQAAYGSALFTPLVLQMMAVGEETGNMDQMMQDVAEFYEREVEYDVKNLSSAIEPILLFFIGCIVLVLALGIFMPMWDLGSAAMGKK
ncbi:MAG: type II secretion system F family protein [Magnetococcales bacterium]|nr:type II secretion system F family protein [Magnetococcales bacterium]